MLKNQIKPDKPAAMAPSAADHFIGDTHSAVPTRKNARIPKRVRRAIADSANRQSLAPQQRPNSAQKRSRIAVGDWSDRQVASVLIPTVPVTQAEPVSPRRRQDVVGPMPRRLLRKPAAPEKPETYRAVSARLKVTSVPSVSRAMLIGRLWVWINVIVYFVGQVLRDVFSRRDSEARRAVHFRRSLERAGGTLVKIGQQMSLRLDILPVSYCEQLAMMRDKLPPFPTADAVQVIERTTGRRIQEIFSTFDPVAVDSSSVWCVYQAVLRENGERVAVKVRRPGCHILFEADLRILSLLTHWAEALTLISPGFSEDFYHELRQTLTDELDFKRGARYDELFSRHARKA